MKLYGNTVQIVERDIMKDSMIIDCFAGGGGASVGIEMALGRQVDIAINHDPDAILMHKANHPDTLHLTEDIFNVDLQKYVKGRHVSLMWASPDCTSHSKAKGGFLRMLKPEELKLGQGFPEDYVIDRDYNGNRYPVSKQVARIGNSVVPIMAKKLVEANCGYLKRGERQTVWQIKNFVEEKNGQMRLA